MKKYQKIILNSLAASVTLLGSYGCSEMLIEKPKATIALTGFNPLTLEQALIASYEPLTRSRGRLWESTMSLALNMMSDYFDGGNLPGSGFSDYRYMNAAVIAGDLNNSWSSLYEAIGKANTVIATLDANTTLTEEQKKIGYGEAKFIRAVSYYTAVRIWGEIPLRIRPIQSANDVDLAVSKVSDIYKQIIEDFKAAEDALPNRVPADKAGRATAGAAKTALAEVYLTIGDYANAREKAKEVMDKKEVYGYDLEPDFASIFSPTTATNKEDIFSLKFSQIIDRGAFIPAHYADANAKGAGFALRSLLSGGITSWAPLIKNWDQKDLRRDFSVYDSYLLNGVKTPVQLDSQREYFDMLMGKFRDPNAPIDTGSGNDFYLWRYADVLLIFAEADNQLNGPTSASYEAINQVRRRGYGVSTTAANSNVDLAVNLSKEAFDELVFRERGYEFVGECKRWFDMVRTNRVDSVLEGVRKNNPKQTNAIRKKTPVDNVFPVPDTERQTNSLIK